MTITLPDLPYPKDALAPYISEETVTLHHDKHQQTYVTNLNNLIAGGPLEGKTLEEIIMTSTGQPDKVGVFNNAGQAWNHICYWNSMTPGGGGAPTGQAAERIQRDLGGYEAFVEAFKAAGAGQFGSGWAWLVEDQGALKVTKTPNGEPPIIQGQKALLALDVWEHAYYLEYRNRRPEYIAAFLEHLVNWDFVNANL